MFAADPLLPASANPSTRNPRRRQRTHSDENGVVLPKAKKRRSALTTETFVNPEDGERPANGKVVLNGAATKPSSQLSIEATELPVRTLRKSSLRGGKPDVGSVLVRFHI